MVGRIGGTKMENGSGTLQPHRLIRRRQREVNEELQYDIIGPN